MGHRITFNETQLLNNYEQMMDEIYLLYHTYPTNLIHVELTPAELAAYGEADAQGRHLGRNADRGGAGGKQVVLHRDDSHHNGIPTRHK